MEERSVTATKQIDGVDYSGTAAIQAPQSCEEMAQVWGDKVGTSNAISNVVVTVQAAIRRIIANEHKAAKEAGKDQADPKVIQTKVQEHLAGYKPGESKPKTDPVDALLNRFESMTPEKQKELLEALKKQASAKK